MFLFFLPSVVVLSASREVLVSHSAWQESFNFDETGKLLWLFGPDMGYDASGRDGQKGALSEKILKAFDSKNKFYESNVQKKGQEIFHGRFLFMTVVLFQKGFFHYLTTVFPHLINRFIHQIKPEPEFMKLMNKIKK